MSRTLHRSPRHLDAPLRLGPLTLAQWAVVVVAGLLAWAALTQLAFLPVLWRVVAGGAVVGLALGFAGNGEGRALLELPRRGWHSLVAPREADARALVQALVAVHPQRRLRVPQLQRDDLGGAALLALGAVPQPLHQQWMLRPL